MPPLKHRLASGDTVTAAWANLGAPDTAELMVRHGWRVIVIDGEHGIGGIETWVAIARAVEAAGGEVILRVPDGTEPTLKRVLDRGFRSIMVPMVTSPDQARAIATFCRYPPLGSRGYAAPIVRGSGFGTIPDYVQSQAAQDLFLTVQCEHVDAIAHLPEIAAIPGIDMIFVGPNDLSGSIGRLERMQEPEPQALLAEIEALSRQHGFALGTITGAGRGWADLQNLGYRLLIGPNDISLLIAATRAAAADRDAALHLTPAETTPQRSY